MATRMEIVDKAREYLGVRWQHQGRTQNGLDCIGLVVRVAHDLDLFRADASNYDRRSPDGVALMRGLQENLDQHDQPWLPGDVLLMRFSLIPQHVALVTDLGIIHAYARIGKVVEHSLDARWSAGIVTGYSFKGVV